MFQERAERFEGRVLDVNGSCRVDGADGPRGKNMTGIEGGRRDGEDGRRGVRCFDYL